ncbi:MAG: glycosyltransferase family 4 protein, partial [Candidatus Binatia bacterium]
TQLLRAAGHGVELRLVGDGELAACAAEVAQRRLGDAVTLAGFCADLDPEYRQASVVLSCSRDEGMGRTTIEAMSYGLPVVGSDGMGNAELIRHGVTGLLYDGSAEGLAGAVGRLLREPELASDRRARTPFRATRLLERTLYAARAGDPAARLLSPRRAAPWRSGRQQRRALARGARTITVYDGPLRAAKVRVAGRMTQGRSA